MTIRSEKPEDATNSPRPFFIGFTYFLQAFATAFGLVVLALPIYVYRNYGLALVPIYSDDRLIGHVTFVYATLGLSLVGIVFCFGLILAARRARKVMRERSHGGVV